MSAGAEEPGLLQALRYLLLTFRALRRTSGGRRAAGKMPAEVVDLAERLVLPDPDPAPLPAEVGAIPFDESSVQSLSQASRPSFCLLSVYVLLQSESETQSSEFTDWYCCLRGCAIWIAKQTTLCVALRSKDACQAWQSPLAGRGRYWGQWRV